MLLLMVLFLMYAVAGTVPTRLRSRSLLSAAERFGCPIGVHLWGYVRSGDAIGDESNFQSVSAALLSLFIMSTGQNWYAWRSLVESIFAHCKRCIIWWMGG